MIKEAEVQNAYLLGRQEAMEKLANRQEGALQELALTLGVGGLANYLGKREALSRGNKRAQMEAAGVLAPLGYNIVGGLAGTALGNALYSGGVPANVARSVANLGGLSGLAYGGLRAFRRPGEM
jgi:hypothetical protein